MNLARLKLVTFDVTGTILQFRNKIGKQYNEIGALYGVTCNDKDLSTHFKTNWHQLKQEHPNFGRETGIGWEQWWKIMVHRTFKAANNEVDAEKLDLIASYLIDAYKTAQCWQQCYGALGLLSYLRNRGVTLGIISNFDERLPTLLENTKLRHYFRFVLASYESGLEKPDARMFESARRMSQIPQLHSDQCLHVGNTLMLDYMGAKNAGWNAALVSEKDILIENVNPSEVYRTLYDLHKHFVNSNDKKTE